MQQLKALKFGYWELTSLASVKRKAVRYKVVDFCTRRERMSRTLRLFLWGEVVDAVISQTFVLLSRLNIVDI